MDQVLEFWLQQQSFQWMFRVDFFRIDWFDLFVVQGTLKSLLQNHISKALIVWCSAFFMVQLSYLYIGKAIALTIQNFVAKRYFWFLICCLSCYSFLSKEQVSLNFLLINLFELEANYFTILWWFCHTLTWISHDFSHHPQWFWSPRK